jgi:hypothetical protein
MTISRRQFILGTASGLILPSYYETVLGYFENHGEPLIEVPKQFDTDLVAVEYGRGAFQLNLGDPGAEPPEMTVREYALEFCGSEEVYQSEWCDGEEVDFDALIDYEFVIDSWARTDSRAPTPLERFVSSMVPARAVTTWASKQRMRFRSACCRNG